MAAGRKPLPTNVKLLRGNPGKRAINRDEPRPPATIPEAPDHLEGPALREWHRISARLYDCGLLSDIDGQALALYCEVWERYLEAQVQLKRMGALVKAPSGYPIQNPYLAIVNKCLDQMRGFLTEFGMTPSSRSRISALKPKAEEDEKMERLLFGKPKII